jgi:hypothetical protein
MVAARGAMDAIEYVGERQLVVYGHRLSLLQDGSLFVTQQLPENP